MRHSRINNPVIAERIQQVFDENNLSDRQVAEAIGYERKSILAYRNAYATPPIKFVRYLCSTYHVSADWLLDLEAPKNKNLCIDCEHCELAAVTGRSTKIYGCKFSKSPKYTFTKACTSHFERRADA